MNIIKPGLFSQTSHADVRRNEYDLKNEILINNNVNIDYLFVGDSITARWELEAYFSNKGCVINRGISGDNSHYLKMRIKADAIQLHPKNVILWIGVNDTMFYGTDYSLVDTTFNGIRTNCIRNIKDIINELQNANINIIVFSIFPINVVEDKYNNERNMLIKEINKEVKIYCTNQNIKYIDFHKELVKDDGLTLKDGYTSDGIHLNVKGYNFVYQRLIINM